MLSESIAEGLQFFLKLCRQYSEPHPVSCLIDTETPGGEADYMMPRLYPGHELPQFRELTTKKWEQTDPGTEG